MYGSLRQAFKIVLFAAVNISCFIFSCKKSSIISSEPKGGDIHQLIASVPVIWFTYETVISIYSM